MKSSFFTQIGNDIYGKAAGDSSGTSVSLSSDGSVVAIGAPQYQNGGDNGYVRIYKNVNNNWTQIGGDIYGEVVRGYGSGSGNSISLSSDGSVIAIGDNGNIGKGHVRVYQNINNTWIQLGGDLDGEDNFDKYGSSVSLSSDGSVIAIGGPAFRGNQYTSYQGNRPNGYVRIYKYVNNSWTKVGADINGDATGDESGYSVSLSSDGSIVAIGAPYNDGNGNDSGNVRIYQNVNDSWTQVGSDLEGEANSDQSGYSVSLSSDGSVVAIGAPDNSSQHGHVRIYKNVNNNWTQIGSDIDGGAFRDRMGHSVSLSSDGSVIAIGAPDNYINGTDGAGNSGHVRIYQNINDTWTQVGSNIEGSPAIPTKGWDFFGSSVSLSADGSSVAIGAHGNDANGDQSGHVQIYQITYGTGTTLSDLEAYNYIASNNDLISAFGIDIEAAKSHYTNYGKSEGRSINTFSASNYLSKYSDLAAAFGNDETLALKHYIQNGYAEGRTDSSSGSNSGSSSGAGSNSGSSSGSGSNTSLPTALSDFQALNYVASNNDLITAFGINVEAAKSHYTNYGKSEGRSINTFSASGYLATYSDLSSAFGNDETLALKHYIQSGYSEGRKVSSSGSNSGYGSSSSSSSSSGSGSGANTSSPTALTDFQAFNYIASNSDLIFTFGIDIEAAKSHYTNYGKSEGRPLDDFDEWGYLASNIGLIAPLGTSPTEAIKHYILYGNVEGRSTTIFNAQSYLNNYSDLKSAFGNDHTLAAKHYVESGFYEGRVF